MLYYEEGDLLSGKYDIICHQVNCQGVMGAGLAKQIKYKYPEVFDDYVEFCVEDAPLGTSAITQLNNGKLCISMFAQDKYGRDRCYTDYVAFDNCLNMIALYIQTHHLSSETTIAFPYKIGCGLAGGDWEIIKWLLNDFSERVKCKVIIVNKI